MATRKRRTRIDPARILLRTFAGIVFAFLMLPLIVVFPISFSAGNYLRFPPPGFSTRWYERYWNDPAWIDATIRSLEVGIATTILALAIGIPLAFGLTRARFPAGR